MSEDHHIPTAKKILSAVSWSFTGKTIFAFLKFFESILLVRLLGSEQFGLYGSLINFLSIGTLLISFGFESILNKYVPLLKVEKRFDDLRLLLRFVFTIRFAMFIPIAVALFFSSDMFAFILFHNSAAGYYLRWILLVFALLLFQYFFRIIIDTSYQIRYLSIADIIVQLLFLIVAAVCIYQGFGLMGVLYALLISQALLLILFFLKFRSILSGLPRGETWTYFNTKSYFSYGFIMYLYAIVTFFLGKGLDILLLGIMLGDMTQIAFYIIAFNLAWYSTGFLEMSISGSYVMSLMVENHLKKNYSNLRRIYAALFEWNYILIIPVVLGGVLLRNEIIQVLFSSKNIGAAPFLMVFLIAIGIGRHLSITQSFLAVIGGEKKLLLSRFIVGMLNILFAFILIPRFGAMGMAFATGVSLALSVIYESILLHKLIQLPNCWPFIRKAFAASVVMLIPLVAIYLTVPLSSPVSLFLLLISAIIFYAVLLTKFKPISTEHIHFVIRGNPRLEKMLQKLM